MAAQAADPLNSTSADELAATREVIDGFAKIADTQAVDNVQFYQREKELLDLWSRLNDLKLELEIFKAQKTVEADALNIADDDLDAEIEKEEKECLNARTEYLLRKSVIEDTIIAAPILNAIHAGEDASPNERLLKPLLDRRDALEIASTNLASLHQSVVGKTRAIQLADLPVQAENRELAAQVRELVKKIEGRKAEVLEDEEAKAQVDAAKKDADAAVKQWRTMKNVVSAVVAASGVDWAGDDVLRELVLDAEDEND